MIIDMTIILGGILLGLASGILLLVRGQILGCSGKLFRSWDFAGFKPDLDNLLFTLGLLISGIIFNAIQDVPNPFAVFNIKPWHLFIGGFLVGGGAYLGNGCTSGHGLCGMSLLRKRSIIAVAVFFPVAIITAWLVH
jgi:uncharacterized membrane protein YedE/YeeE